jgi:VIT1/CCC1 family predicted Fe2+/Mn2+ transporter
MSRGQPITPSLSRAIAVIAVIAAIAAIAVMGATSAYKRRTSLPMTVRPVAIAIGAGGLG